MVVFGTQADGMALFPDTTCSGGLGLADCTDSSDDNISFVFYGCMPAAQQSDMKRIAFTSLTVLGFGWGLDNLVATGQIMGSYTSTGVHFGSVCSATSTGNCTHVSCPAGQQNSSANLLNRLGARVDDGAPTVTITDPADHQIVASSFDVSADVVDAFGGLDVELEESWGRDRCSRTPSRRTRGVSAACPRARGPSGSPPPTPT